MMKAYLPAISTITLILLLSLWVEYQMDRDAQLWQAELQMAQEECMQEAWPDVRAHLDHVHQSWAARERFLRIFFPHNVLDEANTLFAQTKVFADIEEQGEALSQLAALQAQLHTLQDMERLTLENIL